MSSGKVVQVIGAVIDVEFPRDSVPQVYDALTVSTKGFITRRSPCSMAQQTFH